MTTRLTPDGLLNVLLRRQTRLTPDGLLNVLLRRQGDLTQKDYAKQLGISQQYLCDIYQRRREPGPSVLKALGLRRIVLYERTT